MEERHPVLEKRCAGVEWEYAARPRAASTPDSGSAKSAQIARARARLAPRRRALSATSSRSSPPSSTRGFARLAQGDAAGARARSARGGNRSLVARAAITSSMARVQIRGLVRPLRGRRVRRAAAPRAGSSDVRGVEARARAAHAPATRCSSEAQVADRVRPRERGALARWSAPGTAAQLERIRRPTAVARRAARPRGCVAAARGGSAGASPGQLEAASAGFAPKVSRLSRPAPQRRTASSAPGGARDDARAAPRTICAREDAGIADPGAGRRWSRRSARGCSPMGLEAELNPALRA